MAVRDLLAFCHATEAITLLSQPGSAERWVAQALLCYGVSGTAQGFEMKKRQLLPIVAILFALCSPGSAQGAMAVADPQLTLVDHDEGYVHFLVYNGWHKTIDSLYGRVYGYGGPERPGLHLVNNPHAQGMKISLGPHLPGSMALYRFMTPKDQTWFHRYTLTINDKSLHHPRKILR